MKKLTLVVLALTLVPVFFSCEDYDKSQPEVDAIEVASSIRYPCVIDEVCFPIFEPGRKLYFTPANWICAPDPRGECRIYTGREHCFPIFIDCFWDPFWWIDPWEWEQFLNPRDIIDFRDWVDPVIDPIEQFATFPINEHLLGLQHFLERPGLIDKEVFNVHTSLPLDKETVEAIGLKGNVIPAGKYPVAYNQENGTLNAIVSVSTFPIIRTVSIGVAPYNDQDLTKFLLKPQFEKVPGAKLIERAEGFEIDWERDPTPTPTIVLFTPNSFSLGIQILGNPSPQSNITLTDNIELSTEIAGVLGIAAFKLTNENLEQMHDEKSGTTTILIHKPL